MGRRDPLQSMAAIDELLWKVWDPIGVNDVPEAPAEYAAVHALRP